MTPPPRSPGQTPWSTPAKRRAAPKIVTPNTAPSKPLPIRGMLIAAGVIGAIGIVSALAVFLWPEPRKPVAAAEPIAPREPEPPPPPAPAPVRPTPSPRPPPAPIDPAALTGLTPVAHGTPRVPTAADLAALAPPSAPSAPPAASPTMHNPKFEALQVRARERIVSQLRPLQHAALENCWPDRPSNAPPVNMRYTFSFDRQGRETSRSVNPGAGSAPPAVVTCLRNTTIPAMSVDGADQHVTVNVDMPYQ